MATKQIKVAETGQLNPGQMTRVIVNKQTLLLANIDGTIYAIDDQCTHEDASLYNGALKGNCVECPLHGSHFDLRTGKPQQGPATEAVKTYPVEEKSDGIYISL